MVQHIKIIGTKKAAREMKAAASKFEPQMKRNLRKAGEVVIGEAKKQFQGIRTRAKYLPGGPKGRTLRDPPRAVTSRPHKLGTFTTTYKKSITQEMKQTGKKKWSTTVGPQGAPYARSHEFGLGHMPKRQVLTPAVKKATPKVVKLIGATFKVI